MIVADEEDVLNLHEDRQQRSMLQIEPILLPTRRKTRHISVAYMMAGRLRMLWVIGMLIS